MIASQKYWHISMNMEGEQGFPLKVFLLIWLNILVFNSATIVKNSGLKSESLSSESFWRSFSSLVGRINIEQSLSLKKLISSFLILFFLTTISELPVWNFKAFSRYYFGKIVFPSRSSNLKAKSLTSHKKLGKQLKISSMSFEFPFWRSLLKLMIKLRL